MAKIERRRERCHAGEWARFVVLLLTCSFAQLFNFGAGCRRDDEAGDPAVTPRSQAAKVFTDVTTEAGIAHRHEKPVLDRKLDPIMPWVASVGAAACAADFNNNGRIDLYVTNSRKGTPNFLYHNNGDGTFTDAAVAAGVAYVNGDDGTSMDCIWGDFDNDGHSDLYIVRWGRDMLLRNTGDGTFTDVTEKLFRRRDGSPGIDWANGTGAVWFDYNLDGRLDVYVANFFDEVDLWNLPHTRIMHDDFEQARNGGRNFLYRQEPDGRFTEVAAELGVDDSGWTLAVGSGDVNNDGRPDLYLANDFGTDKLLINHGGVFEDVSFTAIGTDSKKGMNVDFGDFNNDGWLDIYITNITTAEYLQEGNMLWHNNGHHAEGRLTFTDVALETGTFDGGWGWGAKFFDFNHSGRLDLITVNGFISAGKGEYWFDLASWTVTGQDVAEALNWPPIGDRSFSGYEAVRFWRNDNLGTFTEVARPVGIDNDRDGRGVVVFDYDNDGDLDVFLANQGQPPNLYRNETITSKASQRTSGHEGRKTRRKEDRRSKIEDRKKEANLSDSAFRSSNFEFRPSPRQWRNWLMVDLEGDPATGINRDAVGARVTIVTENGIQIRERDGGNSFAGQSDPRLHFGLGIEERVKLLEVRWPDGGLQYLENVAAKQLVRVRQDPALYATKLAVEVGLPKPWTPESEADATAAVGMDDGAGLRPPKLARLVSDVGELDQMLASMEERLRERPAGFTLASTYRQYCALNDRHDRAINFFRKLVAQDPDDDRARIDLACALVDKIPTCGGLAAIVSKGTLARQSLDQLDRVIDRNDDWWVAYYCRGMNHLHWPRALRHSDDAAADFRRCIELQKEDGRNPPPAHFVRAYVGLGDALTKARRYDEARKRWREGLALFPDSRELQLRLSIESDRELLAFVESRRSLEQPIDTSLAFLDGE